MSNIHIVGINENENIKVVYIGLVPDTLLSLDKEPFTVVAVSYLDFLAKLKLNPVDNMFAIGYTLHVKKWPKKLVQTFLFLWECFNFFSSDLYIRYSTYFRHIVKNNILIIEPTELSTFGKIISTHKVDILVVNSWSILSKKIIDLPPLGTINVHPSKLPKYRGALPTLWALKNEDTSSAVSLIKLLPGVDDGPLLSQREFLISKDDNAIDLENKIDDVLREYLRSDLIDYIKGTRLLVQQSGEPSTTDKYMAYREIQWKHEKAKDIINKILLYPYIEPGLYAYAKVLGRCIYFKNAKLGNMKKSSAPEEFIVKGGLLCVNSLSESVCARLFKDISIADSFFILRNKRIINS